ncbi:tyrosine-type recombinase/integrase [Klebsiella variicola]|uniref:tyrosine-type recombinase/integrase n=1 Tax=Klebsiella variicola TaxID=244366 RepID=UPI001E5CD040|nr:site-specific integrase [Klebsiella variicola]MCE0521000.1 tyrosine-type recombinase/integrase [Klebsiella variicola]
MMVGNPLFTASMHLVEQWLGLLTDLGRADATIKAYRGALTHYLRYCEAKSLHPSSARFEDFSAYLRPQLPGMTQPVASATLQLRISAIRLWYEYLYYQDLCETSPIPRAMVPGPVFSGRGLVPRMTKLPRIPDDQAWFDLLKQAATGSLRDRLMLALAYYGALRRSEVTALRIDDIDPGHRLILIRAEITKNHRERVVCYSPAVTPILAAHLKQLRQQGFSGGALFRSVSDRNNGMPLSIWSWSKTVKNWAIQAELPDFSTHTFRHLRLTHLARAGWKLHELAAYAGHRDPRTTQMYLHLSGGDLAARMAGAIAITDQKVSRLIFG